MKLIISTIVLIVCAVSVYAQVQKGDSNIGFSSTLSTQSGEPRNINATAILSYERFLTNNISLGLGPTLSIITSKGSLTTIYGLNVFGNYNFLTNDAKLLPYAGCLFSINQSISNSDFRNDSNGNQTVSSGNTTVSFYGLGAKAGVKYFITERINLDANVNYATNISSKVNGEDVTLGNGGQIQLFLGIGVIIGKKGT